MCQQQQQVPPQPAGPTGSSTIENDASKLSRPVMPTVTQRFPNSPAVASRPPVHQQPSQQSMMPQHLPASSQPGVAMNSYAPPQSQPSTSNFDALFRIT